MKRKPLSVALAAALLFVAGSTLAATFTYHGTLLDSGKPAEGDYDIELTLYSAPTGGSVIGGPLIMNKVALHNGNFSTQADFGPLARTFSAAYVSVGVRSAGQEAFVAFDTRAQVDSAASVCPGAWTLQGNAGNPPGSYIGTADTQPLTFDVNGSRVGQITPSGDDTIAAGAPNVIFGSSINSVVGPVGGATIAGGGGQDVGNSVQSDFATVGGGVNNTASGTWSTIPGGFGNSAGGGFSFAAGNSATIRNTDYGTFVWSDDSTSTAFTSTGPNQFLIRAAGGVGINTANLGVPASLTVQGLNNVSGTLTLVADPSKGTNQSNIHYGTTGDWYIRSAAGTGKVVIQDSGGGVGIGTVNVSAGDLITTNANGAHLTSGGMWTNGSSRTFKDAFAGVDVNDVLAKVLSLPVQTWFYRDNHIEGQHMGPMAEDFAKAFGLGADNKHIGTGDETGAAFAAIQGLSQKTEAENAALKYENANLRFKLDDVLARLSKLESKQGE